MPCMVGNERGAVCEHSTAPLRGSRTLHTRHNKPASTAAPPPRNASVLRAYTWLIGLKERMTCMQARRVHVCRTSSEIGGDQGVPGGDNVSAPFMPATTWRDPLDLLGPCDWSSIGGLYDEWSRDPFPDFTNMDAEMDAAIDGKYDDEDMAWLHLEDTLQWLEDPDPTEATEAPLGEALGEVITLPPLRRNPDRRGRPNSFNMD